MRGLRRFLLGFAAVPALPLAAPATGTLPAPSLRVVESGFAKVVLDIDAGAQGAPAGFTIVWLKRTDYLANGQRFYPAPNAVQQEAVFQGVPTLNTWGGQLGSFVLQPGQKARVEIGDLLDETGVVSTWPDELDVDKSWVFGAYLNGNAIWNRSALSPPAHGATRGGQNCTFTQGFWKNHPLAWPVTTLTLGTRSYTKTQLLAVLREPVRGNGLVSLAHQLIATKLNVANGAAPTEIESWIAWADGLIGSRAIPPTGTGHLEPSTTSPTTQVFDDYNNGVIGPGHCPTAVKTSTWGNTKARYR